MAERSTVEGAVQSLIFQNEDNGYTVLSLLTDDGRAGDGGGGASPAPPPARG